jgi:hypothetical protein
MTTTLHTNDFANWLTELHEIMEAVYGLSAETIARYGAPEHWDDYYNEDYSPLEAIQEDEELYWEAA